GSNYIVTGNTVGSTTLANSITGDGNLAGSVIGVVSFSNALGQQITNNSIANLTAPNAGTANVMWGILAQGTSNIGTFTITGNILRDLTSGSGATGSGGAASIMGISILTTLSTGGSNNISQNTIHTLVNNNPTAAASLTGINNSVPSVTSNTLARNSIHSFNLLSTALTGIMTGLQLNAGTANVQNNMIRLGVDAAGADITNGYGIFGIREAAGNNNVHLNSVYIGGSGVSAGTTNTFAFSSVVTTGARNYFSNIFYNARSNGAGTGKHYALEFGGTAPNPVGIASNYNDLYAPGTGGFIGLFNTADQATLAAWRTATGNDFQSVSGDPKFIAPNGTSNTVDLHIQAASATPVEGGGQPIPSATDDYDGSLRAPLTPTDIGADAGNFLLADVSGPGIGYTPLTGACGTGDIFLLGVNITDGTGIPTAGALRPRIYYRKGVGAYFSSPGTLTSGNGNNGSWNFTVAVADLGGVAAGDLISYYVIAQDNLGNIGSNAGGAVATDVNTVTTHPVTPNTVTVQASLSGTFTVGAGGNFTTLTAAVAAYNTSCLAGPVVFSLTDAVYAGETYPITINQVPNASAVNTLTIRPAAGVSASFTASATALIKLNGADWVIIDGSNNGTNSRNLTFSNTNAAASAVLWNASLGGGGNGATNNTFKNLIIIGGSGTVSGIYGIVSSSTAAIATGGEDNDNFRAENNAISKVYNGIGNLGLATNNALLADGLVITQNLIGDANSANYVTNRGIEVNGVNSPSISQNTIFNIITPSTATNAATGIDLGTNVINGEVVRNNISTVYNPNTGGWNAYGIHFSSTTNLIGVLTANNFISDIKTVNYVVSSFNAFGIRFSGGLNLKVYNNSINMFGDVTAGTNTGSMSANIYISSSSVIGLDLRNNILSNTQNFALAGAFTYNVYLGTTGIGINTIDFNDYHGINTATTTRRVGWDGGGARTTLADWRAFTGQDVSSYSVPPVFVSNTDLHLAGNANQCLDGGATPLASVPNDYDGQPRNATVPDIGADEFTNPDLFLTVGETSGIANDGIVCSGTPVLITASGGGTYLWSTGATTAAISVTLTTTTTYTVTVSNGTCTDVLTTTITVLSAPSLSTTVTQPTTCISTDGAINLTVTPTGTYSYNWGDLPGTNDPEDRTGLMVGTYSVTVTNTLTDCTASVSIFLTGPGGCDVCPGIPNVSVTPNPVCVNATFTLTSTNLVSMGNTYGIIFKSSTTALADPYSGGTILATVPNSGLTNGGTTATATASITIVGPYFIYAILTPTPTDPTCRPSATTNLTVSALPVPAIAVTETSGTTNNDGIICTGAPVTLTASGGTTFLWSTGATTAAITVSPTATTTYTVTVTDGSGCSATTARTITVNALPTTFTVTGGGSYCAGGPGLVVSLSGSQTGVNYQLRLNTANVGAPVAGTGSPINFPAQTGVGNYTVAATSTSTACSTLMTGSVNIATFNCNVAISDPCICKNNATTLTNGQFDETIKVNAPDGQTWSVSAVNGLFKQPSPAPPAAPTPITIGTTLTPLGGNMYELRGIHVDAIGYTVTVVNQAGVALSIGNSCQYPNPVITSNLGADFCLYSDPVTLTGTPGDNNIVSQSFTVNGVPATQFNPGNGLGQYLIVYTVNGGTPKATGVNDPGCIQSVQQYVNVVATPTLLVCNDLVYISLDADCTEEILPDQVLEGSYFCYDDYKVELDKSAPYGNGPWVPAILGPDDVGKTYQARVTHLISGSNCWGNIKVEDKLPPVLTCPPADVACNAAAVPGDISAFSSSNFTIPQFVVPTTAATVSGSTTVNLPAGAPVIGFTVHFQTTHTWIGDINATLTSPSGQTILLFDRPGVPATGFGCANDGMNVTFDDGATNTALQLENTCNGGVPAISGTFQSIQPLSTLLGGNLNGTWTCTVQDFVAADGGNVNVTLQFQILGPVPFPNGLVLNQTVSPNGPASYIVTSGAGTPVMENCSDVTLSYLDTEVSQDCPTGLTKIVNRKWTAKDASGNKSTCVQVINFHLPTLGDLTLPPSYDNFDEPALTCGGQYPTPDYIEGLGLQGYPEVFGSSDGCTIGWTYTDDVIEVCDGTYKIFREWKILNWCTGDKIFETQVIKVLDEDGPSISCPANLTVSTDPFSCCAVFDLPDVIISDNCSRINNIGGMIIAIDPGTLDTIG
ncbi:MAG TPA: proprotein convertase P-domain-containing protein, partial [Saprospiraceae bacterium]|nr:proprotein convertase P-domain-containing protein [Saprospiraceae bacterium]